MGKGHDHLFLVGHLAGSCLWAPPECFGLALCCNFWGLSSQDRQNPIFWKFCPFSSALRRPCAILAEAIAPRWSLGLQSWPGPFSRMSLFRTERPENASLCIWTTDGIELLSTSLFCGPLRRAAALFALGLSVFFWRYLDVVFVMTTTYTTYDFYTL